MVSHIVDSDVEPIKINLTRHYGALILSDFTAAFPRTSDNYMLTVLRHLGVPASAMRVIEALYNQGKCVISSFGCYLSCFGMVSGIKQGCRLSPLLLVVVVDLQD